MNNKDAKTPIPRRGIMLVLSSPSGAGKTTLSRLLLEADKCIEMSISVTTRSPRPGEREGRDYYFISESEFMRLRDMGELLEWAHVFGNYYGTPRRKVEAALAVGRDVLFDIDWQGTQQLHGQMGRDLVRMFILPPSAKALEARLRARAQDSEEVVAQRMSKAANEISHWPEYDYIIVNHDLADSLEAIKAIVRAERLKRERSIGLSDFVRNLSAEL